MKKHGIVIIQNFCCCILLLAGMLLAADPVRAEVKAGDILVIDYFGGTDGRGALVAVDPATGQRRTLSDFGDAAQGSSRSSPLNVAVFRCSLDERAGSRVVNPETEILMIAATEKQCRFLFLIIPLFLRSTPTPAIVPSSATSVRAI